MLTPRFDHIIVDSPPILAVTDAAIIGQMVGGAMLVLKAGQHPMREIEQAVKSACARRTSTCAASCSTTSAWRVGATAPAGTATSTRTRTAGLRPAAGQLRLMNVNIIRNAEPPSMKKPVPPCVSAPTGPNSFSSGRL